MKKLLTGIAVVALVVSIGSTSVLAAGCGRGRNFVDNDGDGVCDNFAAGASQGDCSLRRGRCGGQGRHCR